MKVMFENMIDRGTIKENIHLAIEDYNFTEAVLDMAVDNYQFQFDILTNTSNYSVELTLDELHELCLKHVFEILTNRFPEKFGIYTGASKEIINIIIKDLLLDYKNKKKKAS